MRASFIRMKYSLTPKISYILGLCTGSSANVGFGVYGDVALLDDFCNCIAEAKIVPAESIFRDSRRAWIEHSAYMSFFKKLYGQRLERFKSKNDYSANYLAGLFDSCAYPLPNVPEGKVAFGFSGMEAKDEALFLRLGFKVKFSKKTILLVDTRDRAFCKFVAPYVLLKKSLLA
ncbi:MAG TPA: hypothetical protein PLO51_02800 [Candidatus Micrarchaeota archaeon]|nr:hypothetical protein [Candidatus Micrarchaeota archaeon]